MFFNRCGAFSVKRNSREVIDSLRYTSSVLDNPQNLVTIYPSGDIFSQHKQIIKFKKGIDRILSQSKMVSIVLAVVLIDYFSMARPKINIYLKNYSGEQTAKAIENVYNSFYQSCILKQTK